MSLLKFKESPTTMLPRLVLPAKLATDKRSAAVSPSEMHETNANLQVIKAIHSSSRENEQNNLIVQHSDHTDIECTSKVQLPMLSLCTRSECAEQLRREYDDAKETSEIVIRLFHEFIENNHTKQSSNHFDNQKIRTNKNSNDDKSNSNMASPMNEYYYLFDNHRHNNNVNGGSQNNNYENNNCNVSKMRRVHDKHITEMTLRAAISCFVLYQTIHELPRHQSVLLPYIDMLVGYVFIPQTDLVREALKHYHHTFQSHFAFMKPISEKHKGITNEYSSNKSQNTLNNTYSKANESECNANVNENDNIKPTITNNNNNQKITTTEAIINRDNSSTHVISLEDRLHDEVSYMHENTNLYHILEPYIQMPYFVAYKVLTKRVIMLAHQVRGRELHVARLPEIFNMTYLHRGAQLLRLVMHVWRSVVRRRRAEEVKHRTRWTLRRSRAMQSTVIKYWRSYASYTMEAAQVDSKVKIKIYEMQEDIRQCKSEISSMLSHSSSLSQFIQDKNKERKDLEVRMSALEQQYKKNLEYVRSMDSVGTLLLNSLLLPHSLPECVRYNLHLIDKNYTYEKMKCEELAQDAQWHASAHALYILVQWGNYMVNKRGRETEELCAILPPSTPAAAEVLIVEGKKDDISRIEQVHKVQEKPRKESSTNSTNPNKIHSIDTTKKMSISHGSKHNSEMSNTHFDMLLTSYDQTDESDWHMHKLDKNTNHHHKEQEQERHEVKDVGGSVSLDIPHIESHNIQNDQNDNNTNSISVVLFPLYKFLVLMRCVALNEDEMPPLSVVRMVKSADATVLDELDKVMCNRQNYSSHGHNVDHMNNNKTLDVNSRNSVQRLNVQDGTRRVSKQSLQRATLHRSSLEKEEEELEYQSQEQEEELLEDEAMIIINSLSKEIRSTAERVAHILIDSYEHLTHTVSLISVEQLLSRKRSVLLLFLASLMRYYTNWIVRHQDSALAITTQPLNETSTESSENELDSSSSEEQEPEEKEEKREDKKQPELGNKMSASASNAEKVNKSIKTDDTNKDENINGKLVNGKEKTAAHKRRKRHSNLQLDVGKRHVQYSEWSHPPKSHLKWKRKITEQQEWIAFSFSALHVALQLCIRVKPPMLTLEEQESFNELIRSLSLSLLADILPSESDLMTSYYLNYIYVLESNYRQLRFTFQQYALPYNAMQSARTNLYVKENEQYEENSPIPRSSISGTVKSLQGSSNNTNGGVSRNGKRENNTMAQHHKNKNINLEEDNRESEKYITSLSVWHLLCNCKMAGSNSSSDNRNTQTRLHRAQVMSIIEHVVFRTLNCNTATSNNNNNKSKSKKEIANYANNNINEANQVSGNIHKNKTNRSHVTSSSSSSSLFAQVKPIIQIGTIRQIPHYARAIQEERHVDIRNNFLTLVMNEIQFIEVLLRCAHAWQCLHEAEQMKYKRQMQIEHETNANLSLLQHQKLQSQNEKSLSTFEPNKELEENESEEYDKYKNKELEKESCDISARFNDEENGNSRSNLLRRGSVSSEESSLWLSSTTESVSANWTNPNMSLTSTQETSQIFPPLSSPHSRSAMNKDKRRHPIHQHHRSNNNNNTQTKERRRTLAVKEKIKYENCDYATPLHPSVLSCFVFEHIIPFTMYAHSLLSPLQYDMQSHEVLQIIAQHQEEWCTLFARYSRPCEATGMRSALPPPFAYEVHKQLNTTLLNSTLSNNIQTISKSKDMYNSKSASFVNVSGNNSAGLINSYDRRKRSLTSMQSYKLASSMRHNTFTLIEQNENNNTSINENSNTKTLNAQSRRRSSLLKPSLSLKGTISQTHTVRAVRDVGIVSVMTESEVLTLAKELNWRRCSRLNERVLLHCFHHVLCDTQREVHCLFCSEFILFLCALCYYYDPNSLTPLSDKLERFLNELVLPALRLSNVY